MSKSRPRRLPFTRPRGRDDAAGTTAETPAETPAETAAGTPAGTTAGPAAETTAAPTAASAATVTVDPATAAERPRRVGDWLPFVLIRAAHPRQAVLTALVLAGAAAVDGRPGRELALVLATVLVGQTILGWHNDLVDESADRTHERSGKPIADGRLEAGTAWFALCCAVLLVVPLAISNGVSAGLCYLASVAVGMIGNVVLRRGPLSFLTWAIAFALYPAFLSYGGWGGGDHGAAPEPILVALCALLGIGVHVLLALWGLVADNADGWTYLPLKLGLRLGATKLLIGASVYTAVVAAALAYAASRVGLRQ
ncbi:hypothetical protein P5P86_04570 [Nocardioides sp. BP30]|uniref:hypothetical protein n=1 Tax=Nocardioides sp. BP30 TaxID=3036374 RepID=UPI002469262A|nr:hypothetical protein [Nocardioides sp. BP30]WGL53099.1 hypothetical protein P5P86_04570 [Nocardioides sp. BP30]